MSVRQLTQWIFNTKLLFQTNKSYRNDNRNKTAYFGKENLTRENDSSNNEPLYKNTTGEDTDNDKVNSTNYVDKNKDDSKQAGNI